MLGTYLLCVCACGKNGSSPFNGLVQLSGASPYPAGCASVAGNGVNFPGAAVEPRLAVNPANPQNLLAAWQQASTAHSETGSER